jgi:hypothetical protein
MPLLEFTQITVMRSFNVIVSSAYLAAIGSGVFFGLFGCGGYVWHKQLALWALATFAVAILACPPYWTPRFLYRLLLAAMLPLLFYFARVLAATFNLGFA